MAEQHLCQASRERLGARLCHLMQPLPHHCLLTVAALLAVTLALHCHPAARLSLGMEAVAASAINGTETGRAVKHYHCNKQEKKFAGSTLPYSQ